MELELALLTPIAKAWITEYCIDANRLAIQVLGAGYTHDYPVERLYRDNRLNAIVEGDRHSAIDHWSKSLWQRRFKALGEKVSATISKRATCLNWQDTRVVDRREHGNCHPRQ